MKNVLLIAFSLWSQELLSQNLQLHYDFRHSMDASLNPTNFPSLTFEYFKNIDTVGTGSFLFKIQADLKGNQRNVGQVFIQTSQSLKFWKPKVYLSIGYSGGLGATPDGYGFYLVNSFSVGLSYPFQWRGAWCAANVLMRYNGFKQPSIDPQATFYFGKGFLNYRIFAGGSFVFWSENRNQGTVFTEGLSGKKFAFFGDPQVWFKLKGSFSAGSRINVFYHLLSSKNKINVYPTIGVKCQF